MSKYRKRTTNQEIAKLRELEEGGASLTEAADAMCWDFQRVLYWEKKCGLRFERGVRITATRRRVKSSKPRNPYEENIRRMMLRIQYIINNPMGALCS